MIISISRLKSSTNSTISVPYWRKRRTSTREDDDEEEEGGGVWKGEEEGWRKGKSGGVEEEEIEEQEDPESIEVISRLGAGKFSEVCYVMCGVS